MRFLLMRFDARICNSVDLRGQRPCDCCPPLLFCCRTDLLFGLRYYRLTDFLGITEDLQVTQTGPTNGTKYLINDNFAAKNEFYGSESGCGPRFIAAAGRWHSHRRSPMGNTHETVTIDGQTVDYASDGIGDDVQCRHPCQRHQ